MFVLESQTKQTESVMKTFILMLFATASLFAQSQFKTSSIISNEDKLRFLDSLNKYRVLAGVKPLQYNFQEDSLARLRVGTIFNHVNSISEEEYKSNFIENLHFNYFEDIEKYIKENIHKDSVITWDAECSARLSKLAFPEDMVNELFNGWKNSKPHWEIMLDAKFEFISLYWFMDVERHIRERKGTFASLVLFSKDKTKSAKKRDMEKGN